MSAHLVLELSRITSQVARSPHELRLSEIGRENAARAPKTSAALRHVRRHPAYARTLPRRNAPGGPREGRQRAEGERMRARGGEGETQIDRRGGEDWRRELRHDWERSTGRPFRGLPAATATRRRVRDPRAG